MHFCMESRIALRWPPCSFRGSLPDAAEELANLLPPMKLCALALASLLETLRGELLQQRQFLPLLQHSPLHE